MASQWYYLIGDQQHGPVRSRELLKLAQAGEITPQTYVWKPGLSDWVRASKIRKLFDSPAPQPPDDIPQGKPARRNPAVPPTAVNQPVKAGKRRPLAESLAETEKPAGPAAAESQDEATSSPQLDEPEVVEDEAGGPEAAAPTAAEPAESVTAADEDVEVLSSPEVVPDEPAPEPKTAQPGATGQAASESDAAEHAPQAASPQVVSDEEEEPSLSPSIDRPDSPVSSSPEDADTPAPPRPRETAESPDLDQPEVVADDDPLAQLARAVESREQKDRPST